MKNTPLFVSRPLRPPDEVGGATADRIGPHKPKWGFVLLSNRHNPQPSTRIAVLHMLPFLQAAGIDAHIVHEPAHSDEQPDVDGLATRLIAQRFDVVYFQKVRGASVHASLRALADAGIRTVYGVCDHVDLQMVRLADTTIVVTEYLKSLCPVDTRHKVHVVHDGVEHPEHAKSEWSDHAGTRASPLRAVLVTSASLKQLPVLTSPPDWLHVRIIGRYSPEHALLQRLRDARWALHTMDHWRERATYLRFLADRRISTHPWGPDSVYDAMKQADIGILPIDIRTRAVGNPGPPAWQIKSENRLTLKMAVGLPVIATPIPAYEPVVDHGKNAFLARSRSDWLTSLDVLRDPAARAEIGQQARRSVLDRYSQAAQARQLIQAMATLYRVPESGTHRTEHATKTGSSDGK
ncbi:MAG: glycosyltransferase family 4 protein [Rhodoferax sp.]|nr:glycosyltransferase family 4 protein [Rhodoferax sp.]